MDALMLVVAFFFVLLIGGGGGLFLYLKSRPKTLSWTAKVYQLSEGTRYAKRMKDGKIENTIKLQDLIPYSEDIIVRKEEGIGKVVFELKGLGMSTNPVNADQVEVWGVKKEVKVLLHNGTATILKSGYDTESGEVIFNPLPREQIEMCESEITIKTARLKKDKNTLATLTAWFVAGISILGLVAIAYFHGKAMVEASNISKEMQEKAMQHDKEMAQAHRESLMQITKILSDYEEPINKNTVPLGKVTEKPDIE